MVIKRQASPLWSRRDLCAPRPASRAQQARGGHTVQICVTAWPLLSGPVGRGLAGAQSGPRARLAYVCSFLQTILENKFGGAFGGIDIRQAPSLVSSAKILGDYIAVASPTGLPVGPANQAAPNHAQGAPFRRRGAGALTGTRSIGFKEALKQALQAARQQPPRV